MGRNVSREVVAYYAARTPTVSALAHGGAVRPNFGKSGSVLLYIVDSKQAKGKNSSRNQPNTLATTDPPPYDVSMRHLLTKSLGIRGFSPFVLPSLMLYFRHSSCRLIRRRRRSENTKPSVAPKALICGLLFSKCSAIIPASNPFAVAYAPSSRWHGYPLLPPPRSCWLQRHSCSPSAPSPWYSGSVSPGSGIQTTS